MGMKKLFCVGLLGAVLGVWGCSAATDAPDNGEEFGSAEQAASENACHYKCNTCPPNQVCALYCTAQGKCTGCMNLMLCVEGYHFDDRSCHCVPDAAGGGGEPCGNGQCGAGEYCCNSSCGICAPVGGYCTMQVCAETTL
jgi:hypothetical protein